MKRCVAHFTRSALAIVAAFAVLLLILPVSGCVSIADAGSLVDLGVIDRSSGQRLEVYRHRGRLYVAGTPGNRYGITLQNRAAGRVLAVVSVDGVNVLSGQTAATSQAGYVLDPSQAAEISGWRKSMDEVAAFYFTSVGDSYAGRTDRPQNVGVIGVAVFREAAPLPPPPIARPPIAMQPRAADNFAEGAAAAPEAAPSPQARSNTAVRKAESQLGTGHGERISAPTQYTDFRRASDSPAEVISIYYDSYANLQARGIIPRNAQPGGPNPFPGGFVPDPRR